MFRIVLLISFAFLALGSTSLEAQLFRRLRNKPQRNSPRQTNQPDKRSSRQVQLDPEKIQQRIAQLQKLLETDGSAAAAKPRQAAAPNGSRPRLAPPARPGSGNDTRSTQNANWRPVAPNTSRTGVQSRTQRNSARSGNSQKALTGAQTQYDIARQAANRNNYRQTPETPKQAHSNGMISPKTSLVNDGLVPNGYRPTQPGQFDIARRPSNPAAVRSNEPSAMANTGMQSNVYRGANSKPATRSENPAEPKASDTFSILETTKNGQPKSKPTDPDKPKPTVSVLELNGPETKADKR